MLSHFCFHNLHKSTGLLSLFSLVMLSSFLCHAIFNFLCHFSIVSRVLVQIFFGFFWAWLAFPHFTVHKLLVDFTRHFRLSIPFHNPTPKLQALVYNILPSTTAVFSCSIGSRKLSANKQFFVGAQTVVSLLQTSQIKQGMSFIATNKVYTSANKTTTIWIEMELLFFLNSGWMCLMFTCVLWC